MQRVHVASSFPVQASEGYRSATQRSSCAGSSKEVSGAHRGSVYEHVPLTTLRLSPISRVCPDRADIGTAITPRSVRLQSRPLPPSSTQGDEMMNERPAASTTWLIYQSHHDVATADHVQNRASVSADVTGVPEYPQQQNFRYSHIVSAPPPEELSISQDFLSGSISNGEESSAASALRVGTKARKYGGAKAQGKQQIWFADENQLTADPPGTTGSASGALEITESAEKAASLPPEVAWAEESACASSRGNTASHEERGIKNEAAQNPPDECKASEGSGMLNALWDTSQRRRRCPSPAVFNYTLFLRSCTTVEMTQPSAICDPFSPPYTSSQRHSKALSPEEISSRHCSWREGRVSGVIFLWSSEKDGSNTGYSEDNDSKQLSSSDDASKEPNMPLAAQMAKCSPPDSVEEHNNKSNIYPASSLSVSHASFSEMAISVPGREDTHCTERRRSVNEQEVQHTGPTEELSRHQHQQQKQQQQQRPSYADSPNTTIKNGNTCVPPEAIFGRHGPRIWPILTGGSAWSKSHEARSIPLAPLQRQMRDASTVSAAPADTSEGNAVTHPGSGRAGVHAKRINDFSAAPIRTPSPEASPIYIPLKGSKLGSGKPQAARRETRQAVDTCKTLSDLRIRNQVLESQVLGLSVALGQAHERLNTLTRVCDKLASGVSDSK